MQADFSTAELAPGSTVVDRCLARDASAWAELILALDPVVTRCLERGLGTQRLYALDDLRMEVLEALFAKGMLILRVFKGRPLDELRAYVYCMTRNRLASYLRRGKAARFAEGAYAQLPRAGAQAPDIDAVLDGKRALERLEARGNAKEQFGLIARLRANGHSVVEIAQRSGASESTIRRARRAWRDALESGAP